MVDWKLSERGFRRRLAGLLTERIMEAIQAHLKDDPPGTTIDYYHYTRVREAVYRVLADEPVDFVGLTKQTRQFNEIF
jgi:hypothetical protein